MNRIGAADDSYGTTAMVIWSCQRSPGSVSRCICVPAGQQRGSVRL